MLINFRKKVRLASVPFVFEVKEEIHKYIYVI